MRFLLIFLPCLLTACAYTNFNGHYTETVTSWRWGEVKQLTHIWGRPSRTSTLPNGNKIYIYEKESYQNYPASPATASFATVSNPNGTTFIVVPTPNSSTINPSFLLTCNTFFEVDPRGIIVDARAQGNNCTADEGFFMSKSNPYARNMHAAQKNK